MAMNSPDPQPRDLNNLNNPHKAPVKGKLMSQISPQNFRQNQQAHAPMKVLDDSGFEFDEVASSEIDPDRAVKARRKDDPMEFDMSQ